MVERAVVLPQPEAVRRVEAAVRSTGADRRGETALRPAEAGR